MKMRKKINIPCLLAVLILLIIALPSCAKYGCPAANNPVDYAALTNPMEAELKKKKKNQYNQYTGLQQNNKGKAQSKRAAKRAAKKSNSKKKRKKKVDRSKL